MIELRREFVCLWGWTGLELGTAGGWVGKIVCGTCPGPKDANNCGWPTGIIIGEEKSNKVWLILSSNLSSKVCWVTVDVLGWSIWTVCCSTLFSAIWLLITWIFAVWITGAWMVWVWIVGVIDWWILVLLCGRPLNVDVICSWFWTIVDLPWIWLFVLLIVFLIFLFYGRIGLAVTRVGDNWSMRALLVTVVFWAPCNTRPILWDDRPWVTVFATMVFWLITELGETIVGFLGWLIFIKGAPLVKGMFLCGEISRLMPAVVGFTTRGDLFIFVGEILGYYWILGRDAVLISF